MVMMCLGLFVFSLPTLVFQQLEHQMAWRHASNERVGARAASQFLGVGEETIALTGQILPGFGKRLALDALRAMANTGAGYVLVDGLGRVYGRFVITDLRQTGTVFNQLGQPARIEFSISLRRVDGTRNTLPLGIQQFQGQFGTDWAKVLAFVSLSLVPTIIFYLVAERQIVAGLTAGAVKG